MRDAIHEAVERALETRWPGILVEDLSEFGDAEYFREVAVLPALGSSVGEPLVRYLKTGSFFVTREADLVGRHVHDLAGFVDPMEREEGEEGRLVWADASGFEVIGGGFSAMFHAAIDWRVELYWACVMDSFDEVATWDGPDVDESSAILDALRNYIAS